MDESVERSERMGRIVSCVKDTEKAICTCQFAKGVKCQALPAVRVLLRCAEDAVITPNEAVDIVWEAKCKVSSCRVPRQDKCPPSQMMESLLVLDAQSQGGHLSVLA